MDDLESTEIQEMAQFLDDSREEEYDIVVEYDLEEEKAKIGYRKALEDL